MTARLSVCPADQAVSEYCLDRDKSYTIGRAPQCDIVVDLPSVSRTHAKLFYTQQGWRISDCASANGLWHCGERCQNLLLTCATELYLGAVCLVFEIIDAARLDAERQDNEWRSRSCEQLEASLEQEHCETALLRLLRSTVTLTRMSRGMLLVGDRFDNLRVRMTVGLTAKGMTMEDFSGSVGAIAQAVDQARAVISHDTSGHDILSSRETTYLKNIAALACVPLYADDRLTGVVYTDSQVPGHLLGALDVDILHSLSQQIATQLQSSLIQDKLLQLLAKLKLSHQDAIVDIPLADITH